MIVFDLFTIARLSERVKPRIRLQTLIPKRLIGSLHPKCLLQFFLANVVSVLHSSYPQGFQYFYYYSSCIRFDYGIILVYFLKKKNVSSGVDLPLEAQTRFTRNKHQATKRNVKLHN